MEETVLVTGAAGGVARQIRPYLREAYGRLRLSDRVDPGPLAEGERFVPADLGDLEALRAACRGVRYVLHLGGHSVEGSWEQILRANIEGCFNLFEATRLEGVERVVFASSNHAVGFYRRRRRIGVDHRVRPDSRYGVSKAFGEALGSLYADKYGLRVVSIRIGNVDSVPVDHRRLSIWLHPEDLAQLVRIAFEHPDIRNEIFFGASDNERSWWDNEPAYRFGYRPRHRAEDHAALALERQRQLAPDPVGDRFEGGGFCSAEFTGSPEDIP